MVSVEVLVIVVVVVVVPGTTGVVVEREVL